MSAPRKPRRSCTVHDRIEQHPGTGERVVHDEPRVTRGQDVVDVARLEQCAEKHTPSGCSDADYRIVSARMRQLQTRQPSIPDQSVLPRSALCARCSALGYVEMRAAWPSHQSSKDDTPLRWDARHSRAARRRAIDGLWDSQCDCSRSALCALRAGNVEMSRMAQPSLRERPHSRAARAEQRLRRSCA